MPAPRGAASAQNLRRSSGHGFVPDGRIGASQQHQPEDPKSSAKHHPYLSFTALRADSPDTHHGSRSDLRSPTNRTRIVATPAEAGQRATSVSRRKLTGRAF